MKDGGELCRVGSLCDSNCRNISIQRIVDVALLCMLFISNVLDDVKRWYPFYIKPCTGFKTVENMTMVQNVTVAKKERGNQRKKGMEKKQLSKVNTSNEDHSQRVCSDIELVTKARDCSFQFFGFFSLAFITLPLMRPD